MRPRHSLTPGGGYDPRGDVPDWKVCPSSTLLGSLASSSSSSPSRSGAGGTEASLLPFVTGWSRFGAAAAAAVAVVVDCPHSDLSGTEASVPSNGAACALSVVSTESAAWGRKTGGGKASFSFVVAVVSEAAAARTIPAVDITPRGASVQLADARLADSVCPTSRLAGQRKSRVGSAPTASLLACRIVLLTVESAAPMKPAAVDVLTHAGPRSPNWRSGTRGSAVVGLRARVCVGAAASTRKQSRRPALGEKRRANQ